jgi:hypothetical protein
MFILNAHAGIAKVCPSLSHSRRLLTNKAIRSKHISNSGRLFGTSTHEKIADKFYDSGAAKLCPPDNSAHISAHSAVKSIETSTRSVVYDAIRARRQQELDRAYEKACKRARAKNRQVPSRDAYYYGPWGYPYMMYGPWMAYGYYPGIYMYGNPYCMPMGAGMAGACAAGTCSGGVAAGGCGGPGGCGNGGGCVSRPLFLFFLRELTDFYRVVEALAEAAEVDVAAEGAVEEVEDVEAVVDEHEIQKR